MSNSNLPPEWCGTIETDFVRYEFTETRFIKTTRLPSQYRKLHNGGVELIARPWASERIWNEVAALKLISERTTIPVPKLISYGAKEDGTAYLETERVYGIELSRIGEQCRMANRYSHNNGGPCHECEQIAKENAQQFIREVVLPQLATLQSNTTGLTGLLYRQLGCWNMLEGSTGHPRHLSLPSITLSMAICLPATSCFALERWKLHAYMIGSILATFPRDFSSGPLIRRDTTICSRRTTCLMSSSPSSSHKISGTVWRRKWLQVAVCRCCS